MTRIAIVDPQPAVRAGLAMLLRTEPGLIPVGAAIGATDGLELVTRHRPAVVLLEHHLHDGGEALWGHGLGERREDALGHLEVADRAEGL